jgi:hypothetical protein
MLKLQHDSNGDKLVATELTSLGATTAVAMQVALQNGNSIYDFGIVNGALWALPFNETSNTYGELGQGNTTPPMAPFAALKVQGLTGVTALSTGQNLDGNEVTQCVVHQLGARVACWGNNTSGQTGVANPPLQPLPVEPAFPSTVGSVTRLAAMGRGACMLDSKKDIYCWGDNGLYQLGVSVGGPEPVLYGGPSGMDDLACGGFHCCAWKGTEMWCWGLNQYGQLGANDLAIHETPVKLPPFPSPVARMSMTGRGDTSCAVLQDGTFWCWGLGYRGENCSGQMGMNLPPQQVALFP